MGFSGFFEIADGARHADAELLAHAEQGIAGADQHAADGDRADDGKIDRARERVPSDFALLQRSLQLRPQQVGEQRNQQAPGEHAAGEVQCGQARADDVADSQVGRADRRRIERAYAPGCQGRDIGIRAGAQQKVFAERSDIHRERLYIFKNVQLRERIDQRAESHIGKQDLGRLRALLSGLVNFRGGDRFGEGKLRVFDHDAAEQRDKEYAEQAADHHERDRLPVVFHPEARPEARKHKGRYRETGAGGNGFADGSDRAGHVFFQQRSLHEPQQRHADDRGRIGRGNRHACFQPKIGVGGAQDPGHQQTEDHGSESKLAHLHICRHIGSEFRFLIGILHGKPSLDETTRWLDTVCRIQESRRATQAGRHSLINAEIICTWL